MVFRYFLPVVCPTPCPVMQVTNGQQALAGLLFQMSTSLQVCVQHLYSCDKSLSTQIHCKNAMILLPFAACTAAELDGNFGGSTAGTSPYIVGTAPSGEYTLGEGCPTGFEVITDLLTCKAAYDTMLPTDGTNPPFWYGNAPTTWSATRPYGCFIYSSPSSADVNPGGSGLTGHTFFNPTNVVGNGQTMAADHLVICKATGMLA